MRERSDANPAMLSHSRHPRRQGCLGRLQRLASGRLAGFAAALLALVGGGRRARANGAFPDSQSIMTPESAPNDIYLATNFGVVHTTDGGHTWLWSCEQAENSFASLYQLGPAPNYRVYALSSIGLAYSGDRSCSWTVASGFTGATVLDYFPDPTSASRVLAVDAAQTDGGVLYEVRESSDGGATFGPRRYTAQSGDNLTGVEIARSAPSTVYLSLTSGSSFAPKLVRSTDSGATWRVYDLAPSLATGTNSIRIIAVDPTDANKVFLRVRSPAGDAVAVSTFDAAGNASTATGLTFAAGVMSSFARLSNGHMVVGGVVGVDAAAYRSTDGGASFQPLPKPPSLRALSARGSTLYAVADNVVDGYAIGTSADEGMTWQPFMTYDQIAAIDPCLKQFCQDDCLLRADTGQWSADFCAATPPASGSGGTGGGTAGTGGGAAGTGAAGTSGNAGTTGTGGSTPSGGCHCAVPNAASGGFGVGVAAFVALGLVARRRRRPRGR
jgi:hypothetical protein